MKKLKCKVKRKPSDFFDNYENFETAFKMVETENSCLGIDCACCAFNMGSFGCALPKIRGILSGCPGSEFYKSTSKCSCSFEDIIKELGGKP